MQSLGAAPDDDARVELAALRRLHALGAQLLEGTEAEPLLQALVDAAVELLGADFGLVQLHDCRAGLLRIVAQRGFAPEVLERFRVVDAGVGACGTTLLEKARVVVADAQTDPLFEALRDEVVRAGFRGVQATPLVSRGGDVLGVISTHFRDARLPRDRDLHLLDLLARQGADVVERARFIEDLRASDRAKDELIATLAHELRNPLAPMRTALDLVKGKPDDRARAVRAHQILDEQLTHLVRLVDDLIDVARLARHGAQLQPESVDLVGVVNGAAEKARGDITAAAQTLVVDVAPAPVVVTGDAVRLAQIVVGLLEHAAKHAGEGAHVRLSLRKHAHRAVLGVTDDGPGIPEERLRRLLEPFAQARSSLGVGLTLVQKLVEMHEGELVIEPGEGGRGTAIRVTLPLEGERSMEARRRRALVVDDNEDGATLLAELLTDHGVEVSTVFDGTSALAAVRAFAPDVVFLDIGLPDLDGNDVARRIRASELPTQPLLVAVTGWSQPRDRDRTTASGFDRHIAKPIDVAALRRVLAS